MKYSSALIRTTQTRKKDIDLRSVFFVILLSLSVTILLLSCPPVFPLCSTLTPRVQMEKFGTDKAWGMERQRNRLQRQSFVVKWSNLVQGAFISLNPERERSPEKTFRKILFRYESRDEIIVFFRRCNWSKGWLVQASHFLKETLNLHDMIGSVTVWQCHRR